MHLQALRLDDKKIYIITGWYISVQRLKYDINLHLIYLLVEYLIHHWFTEDIIKCES